MKKKKVIFSWSGGKDSTLCLHNILHQKKYEVCYLLTSINGNNNRVSLHGIHQSLIEAQAESIGIPLKIIYVYEGNNAEYELQMGKVLLQLKDEGIDTVIFGDIFLEDLRKYREDNLAKINMQAVFPLWKKSTSYLLRKFIDLGYKTITCCVNDAYLTKEDVGKLIDKKFVNKLPRDVDPCGENGEYHTFCFSGEIFNKVINIEIKEIVYKNLDVKYHVPDKNQKITKGFWYSEIKLKNNINENN